jgi:tetratricopeptide (TPR) repeat protein
MKLSSTFLPVVLILLHFLVINEATAQLAIVEKQQDVPVTLYKEASQSLNHGNPKLAIQAYNKVIAFYQQEGKTRELSENYLGMALSFAFNGHYQESIRFTKKALRAHKKYRANEFPDAILLNLSLAYKLAGKDRKANRVMNRAI